MRHSMQDGMRLDSVSGVSPANDHGQVPKIGASYGHVGNRRALEKRTPDLGWDEKYHPRRGKDEDA